MARHREFDMDDALEKATQLFWQRGYEQTSLDDLLEVLGIGRGSFYNAFGDKHTLFVSALSHYQRLTNDVIIIDTLRTSDSGLTGIQRVFEQVVEALASDSAQRGCLLVNTAVEVAPNDDQVSRFLQESAQRNEDAFFNALARAQTDGEISAALDPRAGARFLLSTIRGMRVTGRTTHDREIFEDIARTALAALRAVPP